MLYYLVHSPPRVNYTMKLLYYKCPVYYAYNNYFSHTFIFRINNLFCLAILPRVLLVFRLFFQFPIYSAGSTKRL